MENIWITAKTSILSDHLNRYYSKSIVKMFQTKLYNQEIFSTYIKTHYCLDFTLLHVSFSHVTFTISVYGGVEAATGSDDVPGQTIKIDGKKFVNACKRNISRVSMMPLARLTSISPPSYGAIHDRDAAVAYLKRQTKLQKTK